MTFEKDSFHCFAENLMRALALAVIRKPYRLRGEEVRFLRKFLRMTGEELPRLLHVDKTTLSKWEHSEDPVGDQSDRLLRLIALGWGPGIKAKFEETVKYFRRSAGGATRCASR